MSTTHKIIALLAILCGSQISPAFGQSAEAFPLWDGREPIERYAQRVDLPPTRSLDLGGGVTLELVLIPAGEFTMGTAAPLIPDDNVQTGRWIEAAGAGATLALTLLLVLRMFRGGFRASFSLRWLMAYVIGLSVALYGATRWRIAEGAWEDYKQALERYDKADDADKPAHREKVATPFYMGKYPVTQEQFERLLGYNPSRFQNKKNNPVEAITAYDWPKFFNKVFEQTHQQVRLPTEREWEYACRAGTTNAYYSGDSDSDLDRVAWFAGNSGKTTHPVGQKEPNNFGLCDMLGNVFQWCTSIQCPNQPSESCHTLLRGGAYTSFPQDCRAACRSVSSGPTGFRVVLEVPAGDPRTTPSGIDSQPQVLKASEPNQSGRTSLGDMGI